MRSVRSRSKSQFPVSGVKLVGMSEKNDSYKVIADNRQARFRYEILETYEAGIELKGTEVKSIRQGKANLQDGYALIRNGEAWLLNVHISPYQKATDFFNHDPRRTRRLLLHKKEIRKLIGKVEQEGLTLVPLKMYFKRGFVKVTLALGKGKKLHDKRESLKERQDKRDMARAMKRD
jgi:SsrA-binding protein